MWLAGSLSLLQDSFARSALVEICFDFSIGLSVMMSRLSVHGVLLFLVFSICCLLVFPRILTLGKNGDGVQYAAVARNLSDGWGMFWSPYLSETVFRVHHEHPPLVYWIQSLFFRVLGDGLYVEGIYGFVIGGFILWGLVLLWQSVNRDFGATTVGSWWPILLLSSLPVMSYIVQSNRLVITFVVFAVFATWLSYQSLTSGRGWVLYALLSGILIYLGGLAKGPVALFTLAVPVISWFILGVSLSRALWSTMSALMACAALCVGTAYMYPESIVFWKGFWHAQIMASLSSTRAPSSYFHYYQRWIGEMAVPFAVIGGLIYLTGTRVREMRFNRPAWFFLCIALVGTLPFLISQRQQFRYILHSLPFFVLSLAYWTAPLAVNVEECVLKTRQLRLALTNIAGLCILIALVAMFFLKGSVRKREVFFQDLYHRNDIKLPERIMVSVYPEIMIYEDLLVTDMQRYYKVSVTSQTGHDYLLVDKNSDYKVPSDYRKVHVTPTVKYVLYKKTQS